MVEQGLEFVGLHWLLTSPAGLHATARDEAVRRRTWEYIGRLIDLCADLSGCRSERNGVMVFGSPKQRSTADGMSVKEAVDIFTHEIAHLAPHAECCGVTILVEALPSDQTDVINHLSEAVAIVRQICSPAVQTMFDTHNTADETEPHPELLKRYFSHIRHVHVNEMNGQEPGMGDYDFATLLKTLSELHYSGWISVEAFDFSRDPDEIAKRAIDHLKTAARGSESFIKV
jgi:sugar phosphate isomerase/epimerase